MNVTKCQEVDIQLKKFSQEVDHRSSCLLQEITLHTFTMYVISYKNYNLLQFTSEVSISENNGQLIYMAVHYQQTPKDEVCGGGSRQFCCYPVIYQYLVVSACLTLSTAHIRKD